DPYAAQLISFCFLRYVMKTKKRLITKESPERSVKIRTIKAAPKVGSISRSAAKRAARIILAKGKTNKKTPYVRLTPIVTSPRKPGALKEKRCVSDSFFEHLSEDEIGKWK